MPPDYRDVHGNGIPMGFPLGWDQKPHFHGNLGMISVGDGNVENM